VRRSIVLLCVGLALTGGGSLVMMLGGYMIGGEAHSNTREGIPALVVGSMVVAAGIGALVAAYRATRD
jgi:hypothetical protein